MGECGNLHKVYGFSYGTNIDFLGRFADFGEALKCARKYRNNYYNCVITSRNSDEIIFETLEGLREVE